MASPSELLRSCNSIDFSRALSAFSLFAIALAPAALACSVRNIRMRSSSAKRALSA
eukprot:CAMPEP_0117610882 /NCGR_PEP_ID=MMETSP0784-20121206/82103_1 /TAXON_ID=39447 /ORGANISM="" /LENGTH=55 /DNA_ID=CAMNT_0005414301 /DNA_START=355 /DNA_END=518 /DNA_ORIENTATION=+